MAKDTLMKSQQMAQRLTEQGINNQQRATENMTRSVGQGARDFTQGQQFNRTESLNRDKMAQQGEQFDETMSFNRDRMAQQDEQFETQAAMEQKRLDISSGAQIWKQQMAAKQMDLQEQEIDSKLATDAQLREQTAVRTDLLRQQLEIKQMLAGQESMAMQVTQQKLALYKMATDLGVDPKQFPELAGVEMAEGGDTAPFDEMPGRTILGANMIRKNKNYYDAKTGKKLTGKQIADQIDFYKADLEVNQAKSIRAAKKDELSELNRSIGYVNDMRERLQKEKAAFEDNTGLDFMKHNPQMAQVMLRLDKDMDRLMKMRGALTAHKLNLSMGTLMQREERRLEKAGVPIPFEEMPETLPEFDQSPAPAELPAPRVNKSQQYQDIDPLDERNYGPQDSPLFRRFLQMRKAGWKGVTPEELSKTTTGNPGESGRTNTAHFSEWINQKQRENKGQLPFKSRWAAIQAFEEDMASDPVGNMPPGFYLTDAKWEQTYKTLKKMKSKQQRIRWWAEVGASWARKWEKGVENRKKREGKSKVDITSAAQRALK